MRKDITTSWKENGVNIKIYSSPLPYVSPDSRKKEKSDDIISNTVAIVNRYTVNFFKWENTLN